MKLKFETLPMITRKIKLSTSLQRAAHQLVAASRKEFGIPSRPCCICGNRKAIAHHEDYKLPLRVSWLCRSHHRMRHGGSPASKYSFPQITVNLSEENLLKAKIAAIMAGKNLRQWAGDIISEAIKAEKAIARHKKN